MNAPTAIKQGEAVTLSTEEVEYRLNGPTQDFTTVTLTLVSGTGQFSTGNGVTPVIADIGYETLSTAGDKRLVTVTITDKLRMKTASAGVIAVSW